jgi:hypothetical protein
MAQLRRVIIDNFEVDYRDGETVELSYRLRCPNAEHLIVLELLRDDLADLMEGCDQQGEDHR